MTAPIPPSIHEPDQAFAAAASANRIERTARALKGNGFVVEVLDDAQAARSRMALLLRDGAAAEVWAPDRDTLKESHDSHAIYGLHRI